MWALYFSQIGPTKNVTLKWAYDGRDLIFTTWCFASSEYHLIKLCEEYSRAGEDLQRQLGAEFAQSAYSKQAQLSALSQAVGFNRAAFEGTSRSRQRADLMGTLGTFGRNAAMEAERLAGAVEQTDRSRQALGRQATQSIFTAWGDLGILPETQRYFGQEVAMRPQGPNMGMMIATGLLDTAKQAVGMGMSMGQMG